MDVGLVLVLVAFVSILLGMIVASGVRSLRSTEDLRRRIDPSSAPSMVHGWTSGVGDVE